MLFISLRQSTPFFLILTISCFILSGYSEALGAFRFAGGSYSLGYDTQKETENGTLTGKANSLSQRLALAAVIVLAGL